MKRWLLRTISYAVALLILTWYSPFVIKAAYASRNMRRIVVTNGPRGFGHIVIACDIIGRLDASGRTAYVVVDVPGNHNALLGEVWPCIPMIRVPLTSWSFSFGSRVLKIPSEQVQYSVLNAALTGLCRLFNPRAEIVPHDRLLALLPPARQLLDALSETYGRRSKDHEAGTLEDALRSHSVAPLEGAKLVWANYIWHVANHHGPRPKLPSAKAEAIASRLRDLTGGQDAKACVLYQRFDAIESPARNGSDTNDYIETLRALTNHGYQVLLAGDRDPDPALLDAFKGWVVHPRHSGFQRENFMLYAATESDIAIVEAGGGAILPQIAGIPTLGVNAFPFDFGLPNAMMCFKHVDTPPDTNADPAAVLRRPELYASNTVNLRNNEASELAAVVEEFLAEVENGTASHTCAYVQSSPPTSMLRLGNCRVSNVWWRAQSVGRS